MPGQDSSVGVPSSLNIRLSWSSTSLPGNKGLPALVISANMQPADHMSIEVEYILAPNRTSGGRYHKVTTSDEKNRTGIPKARAKPKSASFSSPFCEKYTCYMIII